MVLPRRRCYGGAGRHFLGAESSLRFVGIIGGGGGMPVEAGAVHEGGQRARQNNRLAVQRMPDAACMIVGMTVKYFDMQCASAASAPG